VRVLQLLKIAYATLPHLLLHLKILQKLPLLLKIHHLYNLLSNILIILLLLKIHQLNKLLNNVLLHMFIL
jgi:hypothetical protein